MGCCSSTKEKRWCADMLESSKGLGKEGGTGTLLKVLLGSY